jgi:septin family protein
VDERFLWLAAPVVGAVVLFLLLLLPFRWLAWRRRRRALVPARAANNAVVVDFASETEISAPLKPGRDASVELGEASPSDWPGQATKAEERAHKAAAVREGLMAQLVRLMRDKIFQRLNSQRAHLIDSHVSGTMQVLELEERLEKIQSQFQARLDDRERRVAELEKELAAKEKLLAEHTKLKIRLAPRASNQ